MIEWWWLIPAVLVAGILGHAIGWRRYSKKCEADWNQVYDSIQGRDKQ